MICPKCKNKNFETTDDVRNPLKNLGGKENYDTFNLRRYICLQCGYSFMTEERFYREIKIKRNQLELDIDTRKKEIANGR